MECLFIMDACGELKITTTYGEKNVITCALAVDLKSFFGHSWLRHSWPKKLFKTPAKARVMKFFSPCVVEISNSTRASIMKCYISNTEKFIFDEKKFSKKF